MTSFNIEVTADDVMVDCSFVHERRATVGIRSCTAPYEIACGGQGYRGAMPLQDILNWLVNKEIERQESADTA